MALDLKGVKKSLFFKHTDQVGISERQKVSKILSVPSTNWIAVDIAHPLIYNSIDATMGATGGAAIAAIEIPNGATINKVGVYGDYDTAVHGLWFMWRITTTKDALGNIITMTAEMMIMDRELGTTVTSEDIAFQQTQSESCNYYILMGSMVEDDRICQALIDYTE